MTTEFNDAAFDAGKCSYREAFGLQNPPAGTQVYISFMEGLKFYVCWLDCPDDENIVHGWIKTRAQAEKYCATHGWKVVPEPIIAR